MSSDGYFELSANHNAGHQMTPGSLLMYSCDSVLVLSLWLSFCLVSIMLKKNLKPTDLYCKCGLRLKGQVSQRDSETEKGGYMACCKLFKDVVK